MKIDFRLELVYYIGPDRVPIADTRNRELLYAAKRVILDEAQEFLRGTANSQYILAALAEMNVAHLEGRLDVFLPPENQL